MTSFYRTSFILKVGDRMELDEIIKLRRSVRKFSNKEMSKELIEEIISSSLQAPSWKNTETPRYFVANSKEAKEIVFNSLPVFNQNNTLNASCYIVSCYKVGQSGFTKDGEQVDELGNKWGCYDLGLANAYVLLKARELGVDSLIMGMRDTTKLKEYFLIPDEYEIVSVIALGYREGEPVVLKRKELDEILKIY